MYQAGPTFGLKLSNSSSTGTKSTGQQTREFCDLCDTILTSHVALLFIQQLSARVCLTR